VVEREREEGRGRKGEGWREERRRERERARDSEKEKESERARARERRERERTSIYTHRIFHVNTKKFPNIQEGIHDIQMYSSSPITTQHTNAYETYKHTHYHQDCPAPTLSPPPPPPPLPPPLPPSPPPRLFGDGKRQVPTISAPTSRARKAGLPIPNSRKSVPWCIYSILPLSIVLFENVCCCDALPSSLPRSRHFHPSARLSKLMCVCQERLQEM
jgi:hypothetical protein